MLARWFRPDAAEQHSLIEHVGSALIERAAAAGLASSPDLAGRLPAIRLSILSAYTHWWMTLPWWKAVWLAGSVERRFRTFTEHAERCGLFAKWLKRTVIGVPVVSAANPTPPPPQEV